MARTIEVEPQTYGPLIEAIAKDTAVNRKEIAAVDKRLDNTNVILSNLSFQVGGHQQHLAIISGDLAGVRDVVEATNLRTMKIEAEQGEANKRLARLEIDTGQRLTRLETAYQKTNTRLDGVEGRLGGVEGRLGGVEARLDGVEGRLEGVEARLNGVEAAQQETNTRLNEMKATQIRQGDKLADILDAVQRLNGKSAQN